MFNLQSTGKTPILLATDIAARGIHISNVNYVINYDFPGSLDQVSNRLIDPTIYTVHDSRQFTNSFVNIHCAVCSSLWTRWKEAISQR